MSDVIFLAIIVAFFAICVAYIKACDRIIGPDIDLELVEPEDDEGAIEQAA